MKKLLFVLLLFSVAQANTQKPATSGDTQMEIESIQAQLVSLDDLLERTRPNLDDDSLSDLSKWDSPLTPAETEFESNKAKREKLEARLSDLQGVQETELE